MRSCLGSSFRYVCRGQFTYVVSCIGMFVGLSLICYSLCLLNGGEALKDLTG